MSTGSIRFSHARGVASSAAARRALQGMANAVNQASSEVLDVALPYIRVYRSSTVSVGAFGVVGFVTIEWNATSYDANGWHDTGTNPSRVTVDRSGMYNVSGMVSWGASVTGPIRYRVRVNGADDYLLERPATTLTDYGQTFSIYLHLDAGDYFELAVGQAGAGTTTSAGERATWLFAQYMGA